MHNAMWKNNESFHYIFVIRLWVFMMNKNNNNRTKRITNPNGVYTNYQHVQMDVMINSFVSAYYLYVFCLNIVLYQASARAIPTAKRTSINIRQVLSLIKTIQQRNHPAKWEFIVCLATTILSDSLLCAVCVCLSRCIHHFIPLLLV